MKVMLSNYKNVYQIKCELKSHATSEHIFNDFGELRHWLIENIKSKDQIYLDPSFIIPLKMAYPIISKHKLNKFNLENIEKLYSKQYVLLKSIKKKRKNNLILISYLINKDLYNLLLGFTKHIIWDQIKLWRKNNQILITDQYIMINYVDDFLIINLTNNSKPKIIAEIDKLFYYLNNQESFYLINHTSNGDLADEIKKTFAKAIIEKK